MSAKVSVTGMKISAYARKHKILPPSLYQAINAGRIIRRPDGLLDVASADAWRKRKKGVNQGGSRRGAGRPTVKENRWWTPEAIKQAAESVQVSPLQYMLAVMNDAEAHVERRDMFAKLAAQYVHAELKSPAKEDDTKPKGKKQIKQAAAADLSEEDDVLSTPAPPRLNGHHAP